MLRVNPAVTETTRLTFTFQDVLCVRQGAKVLSKPPIAGGFPDQTQVRSRRDAGLRDTFEPGSLDFISFAEVLSHGPVGVLAKMTTGSWLHGQCGRFLAGRWRREHPIQKGALCAAGAGRCRQSAPSRATGAVRSALASRIRQLNVTLAG